MKRRQALKTIGGLAGAATLSRILPACGSNSGGIDSGSDAGPDAADAGTDGDAGGRDGITTYVYMMMENRSYDHMLGARSMFEARPGDGPRADTTLLDINDRPVSLWKPGKADLCDLDPPHDWDTLRESWNGGACDQFLKVHQRSHGNNPAAIQPLQYLTREEVPVSYALADAYTTCDRWFCSLMGPTWPNRLYWHSGQAFGRMVNILPEHMSPTIYHRLVAKGVDWAYYYGNLPFPPLMQIDDLGDIHPNIRRFSRFLDEAAAGTLPPVVYIDPAFGINDDHPPTHPVLGQALISTVYKALAASPQWKNLLLVITYDENGGFYDHVSPPTMPDDAAAAGFDQVGFRVPTMVLGPYAKQSYVSSIQYDHSSALRHLMNTFELDALTMRTAAATDLSDCIDMQRLAAGDWAPPIELPEVNIDDWPMTADCQGSFREDHPIAAWADANPDRVASLDLRAELDDYKRTIIDFLHNPPKPVVKVR